MINHPGRRLRFSTNISSSKKSTEQFSTIFHSVKQWFLTSVRLGVAPPTPFYTTPLLRSIFNSKQSTFSHPTLSL